MIRVVAIRLVTVRFLVIEARVRLVAHLTVYRYPSGCLASFDAQDQLGSVRDATFFSGMRVVVAMVVPL